MVRCVTGQEVGSRYLLALLTNVDSGALEGLHPGINQHPSALKAAHGKDPDAPTFAKAMNGWDQEQYKEYIPEPTEGWLNQQERGERQAEPEVKRPTQQRKPTVRFGSDAEYYDKGYATQTKDVSALCWRTEKRLVSCTVGRRSRSRRRRRPR